MINSRNKVKKATLLLIGICFTLATAQAQRGWESGFWLGASHYFGDLNTNYDLGLPGAAGGLLARFNFNDRICFKLSGNYGTVAGDDSRSKNVYEKARNLSFQSTVIDGTAQFEFNFLPYRHGSKDEFFTPYLFAGLSAVYFNPKAELDGVLYELRPLGTEGQFKGEEYYTVNGGLAYGLGIKVDLSYEWSVNIELSGRRLFTDYLDDVSTVYPDKSDLLRNRGEIAAALSDRSLIIPGTNEGQLSEEGRQRGNANNKDSYYFLGIGLVYYFGDLKCPEYQDRRRKRK
ncbi:MAG: outer membrane beta-barrel protein [Saprospiraceae bacterium]|nr:outer membrane beta-barrel protein [Saprospiraceae bacterium]